MKAIMLTFDSLNRRFLPNYGDTETIAPAFERLGQLATRFDNCYVGSLPCIPARRELHTGRENFLHCRWGSLEPFDDSVPEILKNNGVYTHLVTDHTHYWEDAGFAYHTRYNSFRFTHGQEGDPVNGVVDQAKEQAMFAGRRVPELRARDAINRRFAAEEKDFPGTITFDNGLAFLDENHDADNWMLHIETFDPHEPFRAPARFREMYGIDPDSQVDDWPDYRTTTEADWPERVENYRREYRALLSFCSYGLGRLLDTMDKYDLWKDTMLIVNTDHGFLIGEHGWLGKNTGAYYNEIANTPLFVYDPRLAAQKPNSGELVQTVDLPATLLDYFGLPLTKDMTGRPIRDGARAPAREYGIFGVFGGQLNVTDGRYVYMRSPRKAYPPTCYTLAGLHFSRNLIMSDDNPLKIELHPGFDFTKGPLLKVDNLDNNFQLRQAEEPDMLFDLQSDPGQLSPIKDAAVEERMCRLIVDKMKELDAPPELYAHFGLGG